MLLVLSRSPKKDLLSKTLHLSFLQATLRMMFWNFTQRILALFLLILLSPLLIFCIVIVFLQDRKNPFYIPQRVGKGGRLLPLFKLRTMVPLSDEKSTWISTSLDLRITKIGRIIRLLKLDEFFQLINVVKGDMLLIGPRPRAVLEYQTFVPREKDIVGVLPGISDFASLVMSREAELLSHYSSNPYDAYLRICRPIKSRLALFLY